MILELDDILNNESYSEKDFRLDMAITLYQRKVASLVRSAKLAGLTKSEFELVLVEKGLVEKETKPMTANERMLATLPADHPLRPYIKAEPIRKNVTAEQLMREQNYKGTDWDKLNAIAKSMAIEEPIELLLAQAKD
jgi:Uncharacterised protein family (UPF0175)